MLVITQLSTKDIGSGYSCGPVLIVYRLFVQASMNSAHVGYSYMAHGNSWCIGYSYGPHMAAHLVVHNHMHVVA